MIWVRENWIPGVLSKRQLIELTKDGFLLDPHDNPLKDYDHSSRDLHLTDEGYRMNGSIKPCGGEYRVFYENPRLATRMEPDEKGEFELKHKETYIFKIRESLRLPAKGSNMYAQATAKSTIGRLDVVARLIVDGMHVYEYMNHQDLSTGNMFLEITPITFNVKVKKDISLSQIRFFLGKPEESIIPNETISKIVLRGGDGNDGKLSIDLTNERVNGQLAAGFQAIGALQGNEKAIPLWEERLLEPSTYWKCIPSEMLQPNSRFRILPNEFYILRSKERIALPKGVAIYCKAMDETLGEMRIHYAGFAHPFFGVGRSDGKEGTPLIFEVRGHNVEVNLTDGEKLADLIFYRMSEDCSLVSEPSINPTKSNVNVDPYNNQELLLSKVFKGWPNDFLSGDLTATKAY